MSLIQYIDIQETFYIISVEDSCANHDVATTMLFSAFFSEQKVQKQKTNFYNVFIVKVNQFNAILLHKSLHFFKPKKKKQLLTPNF